MNSKEEMNMQGHENTQGKESPKTIEQRLSDVRGKIEEACRKAGRSPEEVILVAVSKTKPTRMIREALAAGQLHFGENRAQELESKMEEIAQMEGIAKFEGKSQVDGIAQVDATNHPGIQWHFLGYLQKNKIKYIADGVHWIDSVQKVSALEEAEKRAAAAGREIRVLIQVNISGEDQKSGCEPEEIATILKAGNAMSHVRVSGLMGMATFTEDRELIRREFAMLRKLRDSHAGLCEPPHELTHLSMGMSNDFDIAIEEGSTMVRVGSAIFGTRD